MKASYKVGSVIIFCYLVAWLDRMAINMAVPFMMKDLELNATQVGEPLSLNGRAANAILEKMGLQYKDENKDWKLTEVGTAYGEMKPFHRNGHSGYETRWKPSVIEVLRNHMDAIEKSA